MSTYKSGLRFRPPLALGGHTFLEAGELLYRCVGCYVLIARHQLTEGFYPKPCMGGVAALAEGAGEKIGRPSPGPDSLDALRGTGVVG